MMPDSMIERVARALLVADRSAITPDYYQRMARAAIEAMREPTEAMLDAGVNFRERNARTEQIWQAMIDEALKEKQ